VQRAAAENLVPVTLELGGKNPAIVARDADLKMAARRITAARMTNGGQVCLCPDYVLVPSELAEAFTDAATSALRDAFPSVLANADYVSIVSYRHHERVVGLIEDARSKGARVVQVAPASERFRPVRLRHVQPPARHRERATSAQSDVVRKPAVLALGGALDAGARRPATPQRQPAPAPPEPDPLTCQSGSLELLSNVKRET
jgi:coniferyl-aldehyde dehydrogenase